MKVASATARTGSGLEVATIGWNLVEAGVAIGSGIAAGSVALTGFGLDSGIEVASAAIVLSRLRVAAADGAPDEARERRALRAIAVTFFLLVAYLVAEGIHALIATDHPDTSVPGITVAAAAVVVMPLLARAKAGTGRRIGGPTGRLLLADAAETRLCALLSLATLGGVLAYSVAGWWWADPLAGLAIALIALREGREAWEGLLEEDEATSSGSRSERDGSSCEGADAEA